MFFGKKKEKYSPPKTLKEWVNDVPGRELYGVSIYNDLQVCSWVGRCAHSSGSSITSWECFLSGEMNDLVVKTMGQEVLDEVRGYLQIMTHKTYWLS